MRKPPPPPTPEPAPTPAASVAAPAAALAGGDAPVLPVTASPDAPGAALPANPDASGSAASSVTSFMGMLRRNVSVTASQKDTSTPAPAMPGGLGSRFSSEGLARKSARAQDVWAARPSADRSGVGMSRFAGSAGLADRDGEYDGAASSDDEVRPSYRVVFARPGSREGRGIVLWRCVRMRGERGGEVHRERAG